MYKKIFLRTVFPLWVCSHAVWAASSAASRSTLQLDPTTRYLTQMTKAVDMFAKDELQLDNRGIWVQSEADPAYLVYREVFPIAAEAAQVHGKGPDREALAAFAARLESSFPSLREQVQQAFFIHAKDAKISARALHKVWLQIDLTNSLAAPLAEIFEEYTYYVHSNRLQIRQVPVLQKSVTCRDIARLLIEEYLVAMWEARQQTATENNESHNISMVACFNDVVLGLALGRVELGGLRI
ncbi:MAG: hypothetical protein OXT67_10840 [Zetaproteobacteria bacterium]|nr:hypothetical protein [Zetaproteobacteria bacterium]